MSNTCRGCVISGCGIFDDCGCSNYRPSPLSYTPIHYLKTAPKYFKDVKSGVKPFEVRLDDRDYKVGDYLVLREYDKDKASEEAYTGDYIVAKTTYILGREEDEKGFVAFRYIILGIDRVYLGLEEKELYIKLPD